MKKKLVTFDIAKLKSFGPCYPPIRYLPLDWTGTVVDILLHPEIPEHDKLWAVCREEFVSAGLLRKFAVMQARTCIKQVGNKKEFNRILKVCLRFSEGKATNEELADTESAAWSYVWRGGQATGWYAAWSAARPYVRYAARSSVEAAAGSAAESVTWFEAEYAAQEAARSAAWSAAVKTLLRMVRKNYEH